MASTAPKLSIIEYAIIGGVGYVLYQVALSGGIGGPAQKAALSLCKAFRSEAACTAGIVDPDAPGIKPPIPGGGAGRSYPCGFVQDNGNGTWSFVRNYAAGGFTTEYTGTKSGAEQAFNASGLTWCK